MKTFSTPVVMGLCGAIAVFISSTPGWQTWVMFIAWVSYYIFGKNVKASLYSLLQISSGIAMGICIKLISGMLVPLIGMIGFPLTVLVLIGSLAYLSKIKWLSNIPAWFLGLIIFFGAHPELESLSILKLLIPIVAGFVFATINDLGIKYIHQQIK